MEKNNTLSRQRQLNSDAILEIFHYSAPSSQICLLYKNVFYFIFYSNLNFSDFDQIIEIRKGTVLDEMHGY